MSVFNKIIAISTITFASFASISAQADTVLGIYADVNLWMNNSQADFTQAGSVDENFDLGNNSDINVSLALEHMVPVIPNARLRYGTLSGNKEKTVAAFKINGKTYSANTKVDFDISHLDALAYYEILDNIVSVDVGLGAKIISGEASVDSVAQTKSTEDLDVVIPMLYASVGGSLPLTGLSAKADLAGMKYLENQIIDAQAEVKYNFIDMKLFDLGAKLGYRIIDIKIEDVLKTDLKANFNGPYIGLEAHF